MTAYYPAFLKLEGKKCVVIGGGEVAERKVMSLLDCGAAVTVVSPQMCQALGELVESGRVLALTREYRRGDLQGAFVVIAATDDASVNDLIAKEAQQERVLINVVDNPERCDFIVPSVVRRGDLLIGISTGGKSPALAKKIRQELENLFPEDFAQLTTLLSEVRREVKGLSVSPEAWQKAISPELVRLVRRGEVEAAKKRLLAKLSTGRGSEEGD